MKRITLVEALASVPDPRKRRGVRHPLTALLSLAAVAILAGCKSLEAIAQFARDRGTPFTHALGFTRDDFPTKSCLSKVFRRIPGAAFEDAIAAWAASRLGDWQAVAIDGKALRGSRDGDVPGAHLLAAYVGGASAVVAQMRVDGKTNEHKAALELLGVLPLDGKVVTGDAMFAHRDVAEKITEAGGKYILAVKDNQPELKAQIFAALHADGDFSPCQRKRKAQQEQQAREADKGHGRKELRQLISTTALAGYLDWPGAVQVFELERTRVLNGKTTVEAVYGITSLTREEADAPRLMALVRAHWGIENGLHYVRDVTLGEDGCRVRTGSAPQVLAALRNAAVHLLGAVDAPSKAAATRRLCAHPMEAIALLRAGG